MLVSMETGGGSSGGTNIPFGIALDGTNGGVSYSGNIAQNGTAQISVTKKPKYIEIIMISTTTMGNGLSGTVDVENETAYRYAYWSNAFQNGDWSNWDTYITGISDNEVSIFNNYGGPCHVWVNCYY